MTKGDETMKHMKDPFNQITSPGPHKVTLFVYLDPPRPRKTDRRPHSKRFENLPPVLSSPVVLSLTIITVSFPLERSDAAPQSAASGEMQR